MIYILYFKIESVRTFHWWDDCSWFLSHRWQLRIQQVQVSQNRSKIIFFFVKGKAENILREKSVENKNIDCRSFLVYYHFALFNISSNLSIRVDTQEILSSVIVDCPTANQGIIVLQHPEILQSLTLIYAAISKKKKHNLLSISKSDSFLSLITSFYKGLCIFIIEKREDVWYWALT